MEITNTREFVDYYEKVRQRTLKVIACIPRGKFDWRYAEGKFSFADIIRHLATIERYMYGENAQLKPSRYPGHGKELADGPDQVLEFFNRLHRESMDIFGRLTAADLERKCTTPGGASITVWKWLRGPGGEGGPYSGRDFLHSGKIGKPPPPILRPPSKKRKGPKQTTETQISKSQKR